MSNENMEYYLSEWQKKLDWAEKSFKSALNGRKRGDVLYSYYANENSSYFTHARSSFLYEQTNKEGRYRSGDPIPEDMLNSPEFRSAMSKMLIDKLKANRVTVDTMDMRDMIEFCPEAIRDIDLMRADYLKDDVTVEAIKQNPDVIKYLSKKAIKGIKENPNISKDIKIQILSYQKEQRKAEVASLDSEIARLQGEKGDTTPEKE